MKNSVLILGVASISTAEFIQKLTGQAVETSDTAVVPWTIDTKYYTCELRLWIDTLEPRTEPAIINQFVESLGPAVDGVVFLFDSLDASTFEAIKDWNRFLIALMPNVSLLVDIQALSPTPKTSPAAEKLLDAAASWSAEFETELVCHEEDEDALSRIRQALEANAWEGLSMKNGNASKRIVIETEEPLQPEIAIAAEEETPLFIPTNKNWKRDAAAEFGDDEDEYLDLPQVLAREEASLASLLAEMNVNELDDDEFGDFMEGKLSALPSSVTRNKDLDFDLPEFDEFDPATAPQDLKELRSALFGDIDEEDFFLEKTIGQIKNLREAGEGVSDEKRRDMAKKLALALLCDELSDQ
ncbi:UNVERIFIED_CONTAM: hypothetical protein HDU68_000366 [Siphonaria sp. JEL0065]|nr:hypothetical protein HDU68_000366 [Siphonaria sp. JEL0065]